MDNGLQAVAARIRTVEQRFVAGAGVDTSSPDAVANSSASASFAAVLAATLDQRGALLGTLARSGGTTSSAVASAYGSVGSVGAGMGAGALTPASRLAPGAYGKLTPPAELASHGNGRIPSDRLESIGVGSHQLYAPAAAAYRKMTADAAVQGVDIGITDSYRSYAAQVDVAGRKGLYSQGGLAAAPGTSNHGWGLAVDLDLDTTAQQWMRDNAQRYGFVEDTPREPWHWGYRPAG